MAADAGRRQNPMSKALSEGAAALESLGVSRPARALVSAAVKTLRHGTSQETIAQLEVLQRDAATVADELARVIRDADAAERREAAEQPFGEAWLNQRRRALQRTTRTSDWVAAWSGSWSEALAASAWGVCERILELERPGVDVARLRDQLRAVTASVEEGPSHELLESVQSVLARDDVPPQARAVLDVLAVRCLSRAPGRQAEAITLAQRSFDGLAGVDEQTASLVAAVLAEALLAGGQHERAGDVVARAFESPVVSVDAMLVGATRAAAVREYDYAHDLLDVVAYRYGVEGTREHLLRVVPGTLFWRVARRVRLTDKAAAVDLLEQAVERGVDGPGEWPQRRAVRARAELLDDLGRRAEAAEWYHRAADMYSRTDVRRAMVLYEKACALDPDVAKYHWSRGEALRTSVDPHRPEMAASILHRAQAALDAGFAKAQPGQEDAWALASAALVQYELGNPAEPAALIERALLLRPRNSRILAFLLLILRDQGYSAEAAEVVDGRFVVRSGDEELIEKYALVLADRGLYREALRHLDRFGDLWGATAGLRSLRALLRIRLGEAAEVLSDLDSEELDVEFGALLRAVCQSLLDEPDAARQTLEAARAQMTKDADPRLAAWSDFGTGRYDDAVARFSSLVERTSTWTGSSDRVDLGLALLARGDVQRADLEEGERTLLDGIAWLAHPDDVVHLVTVDLPWLRQVVRGREHEAAVADVLAQVEEPAGARLRELRARTRDSSDLASRLAAGRRAMDAGAVDEAFDVYTQLLLDDGPAEVRLGVSRAAAQMLHHADAALRDDRREAAESTWHTLVAVPDVVSAYPAELRAQLEARTAIAALESDGPSPRTLELFRGAGRGALVEALEFFARDVSTTWALSDRLRSLERSAPDLGDLATHLPFDRVYFLRQDAMRPDDIYPVTVPIGLVVGPGLSHLHGSTEISTGLADLRERLSHETGVRIPGVRVFADDELASAGACFVVYDDVAAEHDFGATADRGSVATEVLARFEQWVRDNLFRWVSIDDLELWAAGWGSTGVDAQGSHVLPDRPGGRLLLVRLLRALLREGVSVGDRASILAGFRAAEAEGHVDLLDALATVRPMLYPATTGPDREAPVDVRPVPAELQSRVAAGLTEPPSGAWELPRTACAALLADLTAWKGGLPAGPVVLSVGDAAVRLSLARLLGDERPRVYVLAEGDRP